MLRHDFIQNNTSGMTEVTSQFRNKVLKFHGVTEIDLSQG
jgi:hypothetical protein